PVSLAQNRLGRAARTFPRGHPIQPIAVSSSQLAAVADRARRMEQEDGRSGRFEDCSSVVIGACIEVHRVLGPGLLESAYEACLAHELTLRGLSLERQKALPVSFKGVQQLSCRNYPTWPPSPHAQSTQ